MKLEFFEFSVISWDLILCCFYIASEMRTKDIFNNLTYDGIHQIVQLDNN